MAVKLARDPAAGVGVFAGAQEREVVRVEPAQESHRLGVDLGRRQRRITLELHDCALKPGGHRLEIRDHGIHVREHAEDAVRNLSQGRQGAGFPDLQMDEALAGHATRRRAGLRAAAKARLPGRGAPRKSDARQALGRGRAREAR